DIRYIITHAGDSVLFVDFGFEQLLADIAPSIAGHVRDVVLMDPRSLPLAADLPANMAVHAYDDLMAAADEGFVWPVFDENTARALCYTSGTTGRPKGVLYSHRSAVLHALSANGPDAYGMRTMDRVLLAASMYHATGWAWPYCTAMSGAALILPGRWLDG